MKTKWKILLTMLAAMAAAGRISGYAEPAEPGISCGAWIVYWDDAAGLQEAVALNPTPDRLIVFEALFSADETVMLEPQAEEMLREMQNAFPPERIWLSVVNDLALKEGGYTNKDRQLLRDLMTEPERRESHIRELTGLAEKWQLKGLEIDYENIHGDRELWQYYAAFLRELHEALQERGIGLRVCLEWDSLLYTELPEGPEYSIMCYTLFGYHSGPGPKADRSFLQKVAELYQNRSDCALALAAGGYDWNGNRVERELTEKEAEKIFRSRNLKPSRDMDSGALHGTYLQDGETHTVWYADAETLHGWMERLHEYGYDRVDFCRLGGNTAEEWNEKILSLQTDENSKGGPEP